MLQTLRLLLPALIPSWRFFDEIAPSPRIEFTLLKAAQDNPDRWQEFRPRPVRISIFSMLKRMVWNPNWNEFLFLVSCSERLMENPTEHSAQEILKRVVVDIKRSSIDSVATPYVQFRLVFVSRSGTGLQRNIAFVSSVHRYSESADL